MRYPKPDPPRGHLPEVAAGKDGSFAGGYGKYISGIEGNFRGTPMMYLRTPARVPGEQSPVSVTALGKTLSMILEGKIKAGDCFHDVMERLGEEDL